MQYTQTIPASGFLQLPQTGHLFLLMDTGTAASVAVTLSYGSRGDVPLAIAKRGLRVYSPNDRFNKVRIDAAAGTVVTWFVSDIDIEISTTDGASVSVPGGVLVTNPVGNPVNINAIGATFTGANMGMLSLAASTDIADIVIAGGAAGAVIGAAAGGTYQRHVLVKSLAANTAPFRLGVAPTATKGIELLPGEAIILDTMAAFSAFNTAAGNQTLSALALTR